MRYLIAFLLLCSVASSADLPLWGSWNTGENQLQDGQDTGYTPDWQYAQLQAGRHVIPTFELFWWFDDNIRSQRPAYFEPLWSRARDSKLPLAFIGQNWEALFHDREPWASMTVEDDHPFMVIDGQIMRWLPSPWSDNHHHWFALGKFIGEHLDAGFASDYRHPPFVYLGNNNEAGIAKDMAYLRGDEAFPEGLAAATDQEVRDAAWQGYAARRESLVDGLRSGCRRWSRKMHLFAYTDFGQNFCGVEGYVKPHPWLGLSGQQEWAGYNATANIGYNHSWSSHDVGTVRSIQVEACNSRFALDQYRKQVDPNFGLEVHYWNGKHYEYSVWLGAVRCVLWTMREPLNRLFVGASETRAATLEREMQPLIDAVEEVHNNDTLRRFWTDGTLLANHWIRDWETDPRRNQYDNEDGYGHPYRWDVPAQYENDDGNRWFLQHVPSNERYIVMWPEDPRNGRFWDVWFANRSHDDPVAVFAICLQLDDEYLIYAHAPNGAQHECEIQVCPDGHKPRFTVTLDVPIAGRFWLWRTDSGTPIELR